MTDRIAGAPISWGVCEVPGWGYQLPPGAGAGRDARGRPGRHRARARGLPARRARTRWPRRSPARPARRRRVHPAAAAPARPRPGARGGRAARRLRAPPARTPWCCPPITGLDGYDEPPRARRDRLAHAAGQPGPARPRWPPSTACTPCCTRTSAPWSRTPAEVQRVLDGLVDRALPGHRAPADRRHRPGRADPAGPGADRAHAHEGRRRGQGPAGAGRAADLHRGRRARACTARSAPATSTSRRSSGTCASSGYQGWYVLEQDTILTEEPRGEGPLADVRTSVGLPARRCSREHSDDREPLRIGVLGRGPDRRAGARRARRGSPGTGWSRWPPGTGGAPRRSPPSTASSGRSTPTPSARRPRGRGRLQPAGQRAARAVEPGRDRRPASTC